MRNESVVCLGRLAKTRRDEKGKRQAAADLASLQGVEEGTRLWHVREPSFSGAFSGAFSPSRFDALHTWEFVTFRNFVLLRSSRDHGQPTHRLGYSEKQYHNKFESVH
jgi:hypothetical protein